MMSGILLYSALSLSVMVSFSSRPLLCSRHVVTSSPMATSSWLTIQKKDRFFRTSHMVHPRVDSVCITFLFPIITVARGIAYSDSPGPGVCDDFLKEVTLIVSWRGGALKFWHIFFQS